MKRILITAAAVAAATGAFAAPAPAAELDSSVACNKPVVECARDAGVWAVNTAVDTLYAVPGAIGTVCDRVFGPGSCGF